MQSGSIRQDYLTTEQLAEELGVNLRTIYRWRQARKTPPGTTVGRVTLFRRQAVTEWLLAREDNNPRPYVRKQPEPLPTRNARQRNARRATKKS